MWLLEYVINNSNYNTNYKIDKKIIFENFERLNDFVIIKKISEYSVKKIEIYK